MAGYPQNTLKIVLGGAISTDIWRTTLDFNAVTTSPGVPPDNIDMAGAATALLTPAAALWTAIKPYNSANVTFAFLKAYWYRTGDTTAFSQGQATVTSSPGTASSGFFPMRTALVVSKYTQLSGRSNRGRAYLPFTAGPLGVDGQISATTPVDVYAAAYKDIIQSSEALDLSAFKIASHRACVTSSGAPLTGNSITLVRVDSLPDTQRRRTNKDTANYVKTQTVT